MCFPFSQYLSRGPREKKPLIWEAMARPSKLQDSSDDQLSNGSSSSEEEQVNDQINDEEDEEELQAVARSASSDDEDAADDNSLDSDGEAPIGDGDEEEQVKPLCTLTHCCVLHASCHFR